MKQIAIIGDFRGSPSQTATAHALLDASRMLGVEVEAEWIATSTLRSGAAARVQPFAGLFIAPGSPYDCMEGVLEAIRYARTNSVPLIGTCGGFQHVAIELARNVLARSEAQHAEYQPDAKDLVIAPLACSLVGQRAEVFLEPDSRAAAIYGSPSTLEEYRCSFGLVRAYEAALEAAGVRISGRDAHGEARILELPAHPFFIATLFIPQLTSTRDRPHPLLSAFVAAVAR